MIFNNSNDFTFISKFISKDDEFIRNFKLDIEYKSRFPIYKDFIEISDGDLKIYVPMSYLENEYTKEDTVIVQFVSSAINIDPSDKRMNKILNG